MLSWNDIAVLWEEKKNFFLRFEFIVTTLHVANAIVHLDLTQTWRRKVITFHVPVFFGYLLVFAFTFNLTRNAFAFFNTLLLFTRYFFFLNLILIFILYKWCWALLEREKKVFICLPVTSPFTLNEEMIELLT